MGDAGKRMHREWCDLTGNTDRITFAEDMDHVFRVIPEVLSKGDVCLLSPAAASYGMFRNFEERGQVFKKMAAAM